MCTFVDSYRNPNVYFTFTLLGVWRLRFGSACSPLPHPTAARVASATIAASAASAASAATGYEDLIARAPRVK